MKLRPIQVRSGQEIDLKHGLAEEIFDQIFLSVLGEEKDSLPDLPGRVEELLRFIYAEVSEVEDYLGGESFEDFLITFQRKISQALFLINATKDDRTLCSGLEVGVICYPFHTEGKNRLGLENLSETLQKFGAGEIFNFVHILPSLFESNGDRGFSIVEFYRIRESVGSWEDLRDLQRDLGMDLMVDCVMNHANYKNVMVQGHIDGKDAFREFVLTEGRVRSLSEEAGLSYETVLKKVRRPRVSDLIQEIFSESDSAVGENLWCTFSKSQVDLNYRNPRVLLEMTLVLLFYIYEGADIIRFDAVTYIWKKINTDCASLEETHAIAKLIRTIMDQIYTKPLLLTETNVSDRENKSYFGAGGEAEMVYEFTLPGLLLHSARTEDVSVLFDWLRHMPAIPEGCTPLNFVSSHDGFGMNGIMKLNIPGFDGAKAREDLAEWTKSKGGFVSMKTMPDGPEIYELNIALASLVDEEQLKTLYFLSFAKPGRAIMFLPDLIAKTNDLEEFAQEKRVDHTNRGISRGIITSEEQVQALDLKTRSGRTLQFFQKVLPFFSENSAFSPDNKSMKVYKFGDSILGIERWHENDRFLCIGDFCSQIRDKIKIDSEILLPDSWLGRGEMIDMISGEALVPDSLGKITLFSRQMMLHMRS